MPVSAKEQCFSALLWTLRKNDRFIECAMRVDGKGRVEVQIRRDGEFCAGHRFDEFEEAVTHGNELLSDLNATGWQMA